MPLIAGMFSSIGPTGPWCGFAPESSARWYAFAAFFTRMANAHAEGPCTRANDCAKLSGSRFTTKLMLPCR
jgi:hypothetical protein